MIGEPWFWRKDTRAARITATALWPATVLYAFGQKFRHKGTRPYRSTAPTICIGNASVGGVGKTPTAIAIANLHGPARRSVFLTRGYGGSLPGPVRVDPSKHRAIDVGDEALLLARYAPTIVSKNKVDGAKLAETLKPDLIILDDGFQNPTVCKDFSLLLIGINPSGRLFPAGPMREPLEAAILRADAIGLIDEAHLPDDIICTKPVFRLSLEPEEGFSPDRVVAFCGIGNPQRFFHMLEKNGFNIVSKVALNDHAPIDRVMIDELRAVAAKENAHLITTEKDHVRLPPEHKDAVSVFRVRMSIDKEDELADLITVKINEITP